MKPRIWEMFAAALIVLICPTIQGKFQNRPMVSRKKKKNALELELLMLTSEILVYHNLFSSGF